MRGFIGLIRGVRTSNLNGREVRGDFISWGLNFEIKNANRRAKEMPRTCGVPKRSPIQVLPTPNAA